MSLKQTLFFVAVIFGYILMALSLYLYTSIRNTDVVYTGLTLGFIVTILSLWGLAGTNKSE